MTQIDFTFRAVPTFADLRIRFTRAKGRLLEIRRDEMRPLSGKMVDYLQQEAPRDTGEFASRITAQTFISGDTVGFTTSSPQPLGAFIVEGTKAHEIRPRGQGYPLCWEKGGQVFYAYRVWHPGTKPNDYVTRAARRFEPETRSFLRRITTRYIAEVSR